MRLVIFLLMVQLVSGQTVRTGFHEKAWAICHPIAAIQIKKIYQRCLPYYQKIGQDTILDHYSAGGSLDAYRHCFFMAAFAQKVKDKKVRRMGENHEKSNLRRQIKEFGEIADSASCAMDLYNNNLGIGIGQSNPNITLDSLSYIVIQAIQQGKALKIKRDKDGHYVDCSGAVIPEAPLNKKQNQKKCLVKSNLD